MAMQKSKNVSLSDAGGYDYALATFTPAEAESITGVSVLMQRDWRRRGFLPSFDKHARFTAAGLAKLKVMAAFANIGIGPNDSRVTATECAACLVLLLLMYRPTWSDDSLVPQSLKKAAGKELGLDPHLGVDPYEAGFGGNLYAFTASGKSAWLQTFSELDDDNSSELKADMLHSPIAIIDLHRFVQEIHEKAKRALIYVVPEAKAHWEGEKSHA